MSKFTPLLAATLALGVASCSTGDTGRIAPQDNIAQSRVAMPPPAPVRAQPIRPTLIAPAPVRAAAVVTTPRAQPQSVPARPLPAAPVTPRPVPSETVTAPTRPAPPVRAPEPAQTAAIDPVAATSRATAPVPPRTPARPPARTELERLNPGMPRLVGPAPRNEAPIARPRPKPNRAGARPTAASASSGFSIQNTPPPAGYGASLGTPAAIEYEIPHIPQEEPLWCWAAAAQQAIGWVNHGQAPAQCAIVAMAHGISAEDCCNDRDGICARTGEIPAIAALVRRYGGQAAEAATVPRDPMQVYEILQSGATLLIRLRPAPHDAAVGIRHMIVVRGIEWIRLPNGTLEATLFYNDPLGSGYRAVSFGEIEGFFEQALIVRRNI